MIKRYFKNLMSRSAYANRIYETIKSLYHRTKKLTFYISDAQKTFRDMRWDGRAQSIYWAKSSELLFHYHKLEKGLCMPGEKRLFGTAPATKTLSLLKEWRKSGFATSDPIYGGALETLHSFRNRIEEVSTTKAEVLKQRLDTEIENFPQRFPELQTPVQVAPVSAKNRVDMFRSLATDRRSVRAFSSVSVDIELVQNAVQIAQLSPSACNRQPCRVHHYNDRHLIDSMLELQNGNRGFGHTIPTLLVLTAEASCFFDASERHQPYVDGGLFAMSLILAFQAQGISSCCLNWCVEPKVDKVAHLKGNIPYSERIIMYIAIGYPDHAALVPRSPRREIASAVVDHDNEMQANSSKK